MNRRNYEYIDSGIEWLGVVPEGWDVKSIKHVASFSVSNVDKKIQDGESAIRLFNYTDVYNNEFLTSDMELMLSSAPQEQIDKFSVVADDVLITKDSEDWRDIAKPALVESSEPDIVCGYHLALIRPHVDKAIGKYIFRALQSPLINQQFQIRSNGVTRYGLPKSAIGESLVPVPPIEEQQTITSFLDRETARIDALIQKKERMIELLKEKRIALITQAVAKGLDPNAKMKDSGIEWLGVVPEEWNITRLKYAVDYKVSSVDKKTNENEFPVRLFNYTDVYNNNYLSNDMNLMAVSATEREISEFGVFESDILITKDSEDWRDIAKPAMIISSNPDILCGYHLAILKPDISELRAQYLFRVLQAKSINTQFQLASSGVTRYGLPKYAIGEALIPIPPVYEQDNICLALEYEDKRIEQLNQRIVDSISLLREYRTSLIHHAVTGKIDLRGYDAKAQ